MASLIPTTLLIAVVVYLVAADIPVVEPGEGCVDGIYVYKVGEIFDKECQTCTCEKNGSVKCDGKTVCCLYAGPRGETLRAEIGKSFNDGCNQCTCKFSRRNRGPWPCTRMVCPCSFKNWDKVSGYTEIGNTVPVSDPKGGMDIYGKYRCPKICTCNTAGRVSCEVEPCLPQDVQLPPRQRFYNDPL
ncbi:hypothetical protein ACHWQZ_G009607 [Mnemiopsis leidyi]